MAQEIDTERLWTTLGELRACMAGAAKQREDMAADIKALRAEQERQRREHEKIINRGYGAVLAVGALAGSAGAAVKAWIFSS